MQLTHESPISRRNFLKGIASVAGTGYILADAGFVSAGNIFDFLFPSSPFVLSDCTGREVAFNCLNIEKEMIGDVPSECETALEKMVSFIRGEVDIRANPERELNRVWYAFVQRFKVYSLPSDRLKTALSPTEKGFGMDCDSSSVIFCNGLNRAGIPSSGSMVGENHFILKVPLQDGSWMNFDGVQRGVHTKEYYQKFLGISDKDIKLGLSLFPLSENQMNGYAHCVAGATLKSKRDYGKAEKCFIASLEKDYLTRFCFSALSDVIYRRMEEKGLGNYERELEMRVLDRTLSKYFQSRYPTDWPKPLFEREGAEKLLSLFDRCQEKGMNPNSSNLLIRGDLLRQVGKKEEGLDCYVRWNNSREISLLQKEFMKTSPPMPF